MLAWVIGPWGKITGALLLIGLLGLGYRWATNRAYDQGHQAGKVDGAAEITKAKEAEWKAKDEELKLRGVELDARDAEAAAIRRSLKADYNKSVDSIKKEFGAAQRANALIPADQLDGAIIAKLDILRGTER